MVQKIKTQEQNEMVRELIAGYTKDKETATDANTSGVYQELIELFTNVLETAQYDGSNIYNTIEEEYQHYKTVMA